MSFVFSDFSQEYQRLQEETEKDNVERELKRLHKNALVMSGKIQEGLLNSVGELTQLGSDITKEMGSQLTQAATGTALRP